MRLRALTRRSALKGMGVSVALPFLEAMLPGTLSAAVGPAKAPSFPRRLVFLYFPNGVLMRNWKPTGAGREFELGRTLSALERFKSNMIVFANLADTRARGGGAHACTMPAYLSGVSIFKTMGNDIR